MILDFGAKSTPSRVLSLFSCGRLPPLLFVHGQNLSKKLAISFTMFTPSTFQLALITLWKHVREDVIHCP